LHGDYAGVRRATTREVWELRGACVSHGVSSDVLAVVEGELGRRQDVVDVDDVFTLIATWGTPGASTGDWERAQVVAARRCVRDRFVELSQGEEWARLEPAVVDRILRMNDLVLPAGELDVFKAVLRWARDPANEHAAALRLLRLVRFPTMLDRELLAVVRCDDFGGDDVFYRMVLEAFVRRAEVRLVHGPRNAARVAGGTASKYGSAVSETLLIHRRTPTAPVSHARLNARSVRTAAFKGVFPLPLYRHMRFRPRSPDALLFTAVIPNWSTSTSRIRTESRSFLDHRWSVWIDPHVNADGSSASVPAPEHQRQSRQSDEQQNRPQRQSQHQQQTQKQSQPDTEVSLDDDTVGSTQPSGSQATETQPLYMSMFLCCQSDLGGDDRIVDVTVDYSLFIASASDPFVMERKVCAAKTFSVHGQASGFRLHTRRALVTDPDAGLYNAETDELVIGAHIVSTTAASTSASVFEPSVLSSSVSDLQLQQQPDQGSTDARRSHIAQDRPPPQRALVGSASRLSCVTDKSPPSAAQLRRTASASASPALRTGRFGESGIPSRLSLGGGQMGSTMSMSFGQSLGRLGMREPRESEE
jgi:hypothetical protein